MRRLSLLLIGALAVLASLAQVPVNYPASYVGVNQSATVQSDSTSQYVATAGTPQLVTFDTTELLITGITKTSSSRFTINTPGTYRIFVSAIADSTTTPNKHLELFFKVGGTAIPRSNTIVQIPTANTEMTLAVEILYTFTANQYFEVFIAADESGGRVGVKATAAGSTQSNVACPSVIMAVNRIGS